MMSTVSFISPVRELNFEQSAQSSSLKVNSFEEEPYNLAGKKFNKKIVQEFGSVIQGIIESKTLEEKQIHIRILSVALAQQSLIGMKTFDSIICVLSDREKILIQQLSSQLNELTETITTCFEKHLQAIVENVSIENPNVEMLTLEKILEASLYEQASGEEPGFLNRSETQFSVPGAPFMDAALFTQYVENMNSVIERAKQRTAASAMISSSSSTHTEILQLPGTETPVSDQQMIEPSTSTTSSSSYSMAATSLPFAMQPQSQPLNINSFYDCLHERFRSVYTTAMKKDVLRSLWEEELPQGRDVAEADVLKKLIDDCVKAASVDQLIVKFIDEHPQYCLSIHAEAKRYSIKRLTDINQKLTALGYAPHSQQPDNNVASSCAIL